MAQSLGAAATNAHLRARLTQYRNGWRGVDTPTPTADDLTYARALLTDPCAYCGTAAGCIDHIDHREHGWANLTATCRACNTAKGQLTALRFMLAQSLRNDRNNITAQIRAIGDPHGENRLATHRKRINAAA